MAAPLQKIVTDAVEDGADHDELMAMFRSIASQGDEAGFAPGVRLAAWRIVKLNEVKAALPTGDRRRAIIAAEVNRVMASAR